LRWIPVDARRGEVTDRSERRQETASQAGDLVEVKGLVYHYMMTKTNRNVCFGVSVAATYALVESPA